MNDKKKKTYLVLLIAVFVLLIVVTYWIFREPRAPFPDKLKEITKEINVTQRSGLLITNSTSKEKALEVTKDSVEVWVEFVELYKDNQPVEFQRTKQWDKKLIEILKHKKKAYELAQEGRLDAAREEMNNSRLIFSRIKKENGFLDITEELLEFHEVIKKVATAKKKENVLVYLNDLKLQFTKLKKYNFDSRYLELLQELEKNIGNLDKLLDGPDYKRAQKQLEPIFLEIFMNY